MDEIKVRNGTEVSRTTWLLVLLIITVAWLAAAISPGEAVQAGARGPCVVSNQVVTVGADLTTHLAYPRDATCGAGIAAPYPAVAFAHGFSMFGLSNGAQDNLGNGEHLASWGYVVAIPELPDDFEARTAAMQQVLSYLETEATSEGSVLYRKVDIDRLAAAGHSLGGATALALAGRDPRIKAVVALDPVYHTGGPGGGDEVWDPEMEGPDIEVPVLFLSGESDPFARLDLLERAISERLSAATLVTYPKLGHSLKPVLEEALDEAAAFVHGLERRGSAT